MFDWTVREPGNERRASGERYRREGLEVTEVVDLDQRIGEGTSLSNATQLARSTSPPEIQPHVTNGYIFVTSRTRTKHVWRNVLEPFNMLIVVASHPGYIYPYIQDVMPQ